MSTSSLLTKKEAAARMRVHPATLNALIRNGRGPATTAIGGKSLIREDALTAWLDASTEPGLPATPACAAGPLPR